MTTGARRARVASWIGLVAIAFWQAWMFRHEISPDGVAYLDLSDAIFNGRPADIVNGYWSPLYPLLIGVLRMVLEPPAQWEFAVIHLANVIGFILSLVTFEWLLGALDELGAKWGQQPFQSFVGRTAAYALFGVGALAMISVKGTVPDLFLAAATFAAFEATLRLHADPTNRRNAWILGVVLAAGALTKSFFFPLSVVIFATLAWPLVTRGGRASLLIAAGTFVIATLPWIVALSLSLGRASTGETGALNYAWYVNGQQPPNTGVMPKLAAPTESLPLDGLAVFPGASGTNPLWYDPARWHRDVRPRLSITQQIPRVWLSVQYYAYVLAPFVLALVAIGAAARWSDVKTTLERSYVVLVPCLAGIAAYSLVYTTSRYVAPFVVAGSVVLAAAFPREATLHVRRFIVALIVTLVVLDVLAPLRGRTLINYGLAIVVVGVLVARRLMKRDGAAEPALLRTVFALGVVLTAALPGILMGVAATGQPVASAAHPEWATARRLMAGGLKQGSKIAVMGNPENAAWARLARYQIVAVIPPARVDAFKALNNEQRAPIVAAFQRAGAVDLIEVSVVLLPD